MEAILDEKTHTIQQVAEEMDTSAHRAACPFR